MPRVGNVDDTLRVKFYDKGLELSSKSRCKGASGRTTCPTEDVLRFEVSILRAAAIRDAIGDVLQVRPEGSLLPCLALCCEPAISARILGREVARLRLDEDTIMAAGQVESLADRVRFVVASLRIRQRALQGEGAEPLGRRRSLTPARLYDMAAVHMLACAYGPAEIAAITGKSRSAVDDIISDLHATGIAPNASDLGSAPRLLDHLCRLLAPHYVDVPFTRQWTPDSAFVDAPWADEVPVSSTPTIAPDAFADLIVGVPGIDNDGVAA